MIKGTASQYRLRSMNNLVNMNVGFYQGNHDKKMRRRLYLRIQSRIEIAGVQSSLLAIFGQLWSATAHILGSSALAASAEQHTVVRAP